MRRGSRRAFALLVVVLWTSLAEAQSPGVVGQWSTLPPLPSVPAHMHVLPTGKVLFWGIRGLGDDPTLWDPATATATLLPATGVNPFCSGHCFLADGKLLVLGGHIEDNYGLAGARTYDASSNVWTTLPDMNAGRWYPTATTLANGDVLVVSGDIDQTTGVNTLPQVFEAATSTWRDLTNAQLALDLYPGMHLLPNGNVFNATPSQLTRYLDKFTSGVGRWTQVALNNWGYRDYGSSVMYAPWEILIMGGGDPPTNTAEVIDLSTAPAAWRFVAPMAVARRQLNATLLPDGKVLVTGGTSGPGFDNPDTPVYAAEMWNPVTESWTTMASAQVPRRYHSVAVLLADGRVLTAGGDGFTQLEAFSPPYLFQGARPTITAAPGSVSYGDTFFVQTPDAASIAQVTWIRLSSVTHAFNQNQRIVRSTFSQSAGGIDVVAPSNVDAPPGHYMLFLLNTTGVPSVARIVQLGGTSLLAPYLSSLSPSRAVAGAPAFTLTVDGINFIAGSVVQWNGAARATTFVSSTRVTAQIPASDIAVAGTASIRVAHPTPSGATSNALTFNVSFSSGASCPLGQFLAEYYNNVTLSGTPLFTACEPSINYDWNHGAPGNGVGPDNFSVRWTGRFNFSAGSYTFAALASDGIRVWLDGGLIIDGWLPQVARDPTVYQATPTLTTGQHDVRVEYFDVGGRAMAQVSWQGPSPVPAVSGLVPSSATTGGAGFTLTVNGSSFLSGSVVRWNGADRATTFVNGTQLTAAIPAGDIATAGTASVTVFNPAPGGGVSNAVSFPISGANPVPAVSGLVPSSATAGGAGFTLTVNGSSFVSGSVVRWNGADRATTVVNATQLTATIPAGDIAAASTASVTVFNPAPGGGVSNAVSFPISAANPVPAVSGLVPSSATAGGAGFTLTVNGSSFLASSVVRWNGVNRTTTFVNGTQLTAAIPASDIAAAGTATVTVFNPAPGGGVSNAASFTIGSGFTLVVATGGNGDGVVISTPGGINCGTDCSEVYVGGTTVVLTASPLPGSFFLRWTGACSGTATTCTVLMNSGMTVTAHFRRAR